MEEAVKILLTLIALAGCYGAARLLSGLRAFDYLDRRAGRYGAVDGLRGYLALGVLIHHFAVTWYWKSSGLWTRPPESYFQNLGKVSVAIFFMITGFLFIAKILRRDAVTGIDWYRLYQSRLLRIYPLYLLALAIILLVVVIESGFTLHTDSATLIKQIAKWLLFYGGSINGFAETRTVIAGVEWTLKYEWLFYLSLPLLAWIIGHGTVASVLVLLAAVLLFIFPVTALNIKSSHFILFAIGGLAACLSQRGGFFIAVAKSRFGSLLAAIALLLAVVYPHTLTLLHIIVFSFFFIPVALGNSLFGLFTSKASVLLGEISYSVYLLHGIALYFLFSMSGFEIAGFSLSHYMVGLPLVAVLIVLICTLTYLGIEKPCIDYARKHHILENLGNKLARISIKNRLN